MRKLTEYRVKVINARPGKNRADRGGGPLDLREGGETEDLTGRGTKSLIGRGARRT